MSFMPPLLLFLCTFYTARPLNAAFCAGGQDFLEQFTVQTKSYVSGGWIFHFALAQFPTYEPTVTWSSSR